MSDGLLRLFVVVEREESQTNSHSVGYLPPRTNKLRRARFPCFGRVRNDTPEHEFALRILYGRSPRASALLQIRDLVALIGRPFDPAPLARSPPASARTSPIRRAHRRWPL